MFLRAVLAAVPPRRAGPGPIIGKHPAVAARFSISVLPLLVPRPREGDPRAAVSVAAAEPRGRTTPRRFLCYRRSRCFPCYTTKVWRLPTAPPWLYTSSRGTSIVHEPAFAAFACLVPLHFMPLVVPPPARYPDLYPALVALLGAAGFGLAYVAVALHAGAVAAAQALDRLRPSPRTAASSHVCRLRLALALAPWRARSACRTRDLRCFRTRARLRRQRSLEAALRKPPIVMLHRRTKVRRRARRDDERAQSR